VVKPVGQKKSRQARKEQRRREAELRAEKNRGSKPLEKRVHALEKRITKLEKAVAQHTEDLSDPALYDDAEKRDAVIQEMQAAQAALEKALEEWTAGQEKLAQLAAESDG
jgi:ATP-binding cassette subfamily F protein 3